MSNDMNCDCAPVGNPSSDMWPQTPTVIIAEDAWPEADPTQLTAAAIEDLQRAPTPVAMRHQPFGGRIAASSVTDQRAFPVPTKFLLGSRKLPIPGSA